VLQGPYVPSRAHVAAAGGVAATTLGLYTYSYGVPRPSAIVEALAANGLIAEASANTIGEEGFHPADYDFYHKGYLNTFDHASSVPFRAVSRRWLLGSEWVGRWWWWARSCRGVKLQVLAQAVWNPSAMPIGRRRMLSRTFAISAGLADELSGVFACD
jgi:hypothetical protein